MNEADAHPTPVEQMSTREVLEHLERSLLARLGRELTVFDTLFPPEDAETLQLLREMADMAFGLIHDTFVDAIVAGVSRLCDPAAHGSRTNLSIWYLKRRLEEDCYPTLAERIGVWWTDHEDVLRRMKSYRNRMTAHTDAATHVGMESIDPVYHREIRETVHSLLGLIAEIKRDLTGTYPSYHVHMHTGADALLSALHDARKFRDLRNRLMLQKIDSDRLAHEMLNNT